MLVEPGKTGLWLCPHWGKPEQPPASWGDEVPAPPPGTPGWTSPGGMSVHRCVRQWCREGRAPGRSTLRAVGCRLPPGTFMNMMPDICDSSVAARRTTSISPGLATPYLCHLDKG